MPAIFHTLATKAKEHHEAVNAAYATYYSVGMSPVATPAATPRESVDTPRTTSNASSSSMGKAWKSVKKAAKQHHDSVNAAYTTYYSGGTSTPTSPAGSQTTSPRTSLEAVQEHEGAAKKDKKSNWQKVKNAVKEHHRAMNEAYSVYYGAGVQS